MSLLLKLFKSHLTPRHSLVCCVRYESKEAAQKTDQALLTRIEDEEETEEEREARIENLRTKSRLRPNHRNIVHGQVPYTTPMVHFHEYVQYQRKMWAQYGKQTDVYPGIAWPDKEDLEDAKEYESVLNPLSIQEMVQIEEDKLKDYEKAIKERVRTITLKAEKNQTLIAEFYARQKQKEIDSQKAKKEKDRVFNEIRQHFGFNIDPRDEKFQEMMELKQREEAKKRRLEKKKMREEKLISMAMEMDKEANQKSASEENKVKSNEEIKKDVGESS